MRRGSAATRRRIEEGSMEGSMEQSRAAEDRPEAMIGRAPQDTIGRAPNARSCAPAVRGGSRRLMRRSPSWSRAGALLAVLVAMLVAAPSALAAAPWWHVGVGARPSVLPAAGGFGEVVAMAENAGDSQAAGGVVVSVSLPAGLRATGISGAAPARGGSVGQTTPL
ncbi:MAG: hypothetical protein ACYCUM_13575, partial [Solirubrobacteraceae bacterium]